MVMNPSEVGVNPIELRGVRKSYREKVVLEGASLSVPRGSVTGLLGKNGAGKSTLIKCALGLHRIDGGSAEIFGEPTWTLSAGAKARLAYVPQEVSLLPHMRIKQLVKYTSAFYPRWNQDLVEKLIREWELDRESMVGPLSQGQQQKLAMILALGHEPELLVLDERAASLDPAARRQFLSEILEVAIDGERTVLFSTHITSDLERVADRVAIIKEGRVLLADELATLKDSVKRLRIHAQEEFPRSRADLVTATRLLKTRERGGGGTATFEEVEATVLSERIEGRNAILSVQGFSEGLKGDLERAWGAEVSVEDLNLEEIFLELHHE